MLHPPHIVKRSSECASYICRGKHYVWVRNGEMYSGASHKVICTHRDNHEGSLLLQYSKNFFKICDKEKNGKNIFILNVCRLFPCNYSLNNTTSLFI